MANITCSLRGNVSGRESGGVLEAIIASTMDNQNAFGFTSAPSPMLGTDMQLITMESSHDLTVISLVASTVALYRPQIELAMSNYQFEQDKKEFRLTSEPINLAILATMTLNSDWGALSDDSANQSGFFFFQGSEDTISAALIAPPQTATPKTTAAEEVRTQTTSSTNTDSSTTTTGNEATTTTGTSNSSSNSASDPQLQFVPQTQPDAIEPLPIVSLFSDGADTVDFNNHNQVPVGAYENNSLGGDDNVILPANSIEANRVGYTPGQTFFAGLGNDTVTGGDLDDSIDGGADDDTINGGNGSDTLSGGSGTNILNGQEGDDRFIVTNGNDTISGGTGVNTLDFSQAASGVDYSFITLAYTMVGSAGSASDIAIIIGSELTDQLTGSIGDETFYGLGGDDVIVANEGADTIYGGDGNNNINGGPGNDTIYVTETSGNSPIDGGTDTDTVDFSGMNNGQGIHVFLDTGVYFNDSFSLSGSIANIETVIGSNFSDQLLGSIFDETFYGGGGGDEIEGNAGIDFIDGGAGNDIINAGQDNDTIYVSLDFDTIQGGSEIDTIDFSRVVNGESIAVNLAAGSYTSTFGSFSGTFSDIEIVNGSPVGDSFLGSSGDDTINGGGGADNMQGAGGVDHMNGEAGDDFLYYEGDAGFQTLNGGDDVDTMVLNDTTLVIDPNPVLNPLINIEIFDLGSGDVGRTIEFSDTTVRDIWGKNTVRITGDTADTVVTHGGGGGYFDMGPSAINGPDFHTWVSVSDTEIDIQVGINVVTGP